ncbi:MAG: ATP-binding protein [Gallionellaceae bacterium]
MNTLTEELAQTELFRGASKKILEVVQVLSSPFELAKGELLLSPEHHNDSIYLLLSGKLGLHFESLNSPEIRELHKGVSVGEMSMIDGMLPSAYVIAKEACRIFPIKRKLLQSLIADTSPIADNLLKLLSQWMRDSTLRIVRDRTQLESLSTYANDAEQANIAKSKFLAAVSHDLRQPIHAQGLFLGALSLTELDAHQQEILANANAASKSSVEMLNTLLDFSRIEAGVVEPKLQPFPLQPLLNKIEREFGPQADSKCISYRSRETTLVVHSDPMLVELILRNLVSNAIRYTERGGVLVACRKNGEEALLEIWDTGIGIAPENQQLVFREFLQLANPERDRHKGLGLGLAIVQGLSRKLKLDLALSSTLGRGSVFRFSLPISSDILPAKKIEPMDSPKELGGMRVLVIDDDENVRNGMRILLNNWGAQCDVAESIDEAIELALSHSPDLVISDYRLREHRTGIETISTLRCLLGDSLPALLITGDIAPDRLREALNSGIPLLHKPVSPNKLYQNILSITGTESVSAH